MLKVGGALDIVVRKARVKIFEPHPLLLKPRPFGTTDAAGLQWQEFLGCSNEETNSKSIRTDFIATYSWNFIWYLIIWPIIAWTGMVLAVRDIDSA